MGSRLHLTRRDGRPTDGEVARGEEVVEFACAIPHVRTDMRIYTDEIFGPVLSIVRVESSEDALDLINSNPYGNGTAIFTNDGGAARSSRTRSRSAWSASTCRRGHHLCRDAGVL